MGPDIYWTSLIILVPCVGLVVGRTFFLGRLMRTLNTAKGQRSPLEDEARQFRKTFLQVYLLVMGSDWLQGPYMYSLLRDEKQLPPRAVAILYIVTYSAAAVSAPCIGYLADRFGRRSACLAFCVIHSIAALSVLTNRLEILILGRIPGGIGMTLLWTSFESWMVTEYNSRQLRQSAIPLDAMFSTMTIANCMTAIMAGVLAHCVVLVLGSKTHPFVLGLALDLLAAVLMLRTWNENFGVQESKHSTGADTNAAAGGSVSKRWWGEELAASLRDWRVGVLGLVSCCFEGTMFLFTFCWPGTLQGARNLQHTDDAEGTSPVPYGIIFANFMTTMVLGALLFHILMKSRKSSGKSLERPPSSLPAGLLAGALCLAGASFAAAAFLRAETQLFLGFLVLEACNGVYAPSIACHRGRIVSDSGRASMYGLMRIPLFIFVIAALLTDNMGDGDEHHFFVFMFSALLLLVAAVAAAFGLREPNRSDGFTALPKIAERGVEQMSIGAEMA